MKTIVKLLLPLAVIAALVGVAQAGSHANKAAEGAIKARQAQMQLYAFHLGQLGAMAKGQAEYNAELASSLAANLKSLANLSGGAMWPMGSDSTAMPGKTRAKVGAWTTYPAVVVKQKAMNMAVAELAKVAGNGQAALGGALGAVGKSCGGCHKPYREPKT